MLYYIKRYYRTHKAKKYENHTWCNDKCEDPDYCEHDVWIRVYKGRKYSFLSCVNYNDVVI